MRPTSIRLILPYISVVLLLSCRQNVQHQMPTVNGEISIDELGIALTHEHIMSNFGAEPSLNPGYDEHALLNQVLPYLISVQSKGVNTIFDCTTAYFGRDVLLLKKLADKSNLNIVTNTGFYGAAKDKYIPEFAYKMDYKQIAEIWIDEFQNGIGDTGIKPGFVKLAFDNGPPSEIDKKLFKAGIQTHLATGLTLAVHTADNPDATSAQLNLLKEFGVSPSAWIWVHADNSSNDQMLINYAKQGVWISLDKVKAKNISSYIKRLKAFKAEGLLNKVLLSHDGNSFPRGKGIRPYDAIMDHLIPELLEEGFTQAQIDQLMVNNPKEAFAIRIRSL